MSDRATLGALLQALAQTRPDATVSDFDQAARPEAYAVPMDRRPATMRAPTYAERLREILESGARTVTDQPVGRILDILLSGGGVRAMADAQSPPLVSMGEAQKKRVPNPIKAYHGSPHDFDQFSMEKIGTGEGAQAYGHGLYFADAEKTALSYRDKLKRDRSATSLTDRARNVLIDGKPVIEQFDVDAAALDAIKGLSDADAVSALRAREQRWLDLAADESYQFRDYARKKAEGYAGLINRTERGAKITDAGSGRMYEVNIHADPQSFLDLDAPLSQQPNVREALKKVFGYDWPTEAPAATGKEVLSVGQMKFGGAGTVESKLRDAGVSGAKYLDQGSRSPNVVQDRLHKLVQQTGSVDAAVEQMARGVYLPPSEKAKWIASMKASYKPQSRNYVVFDDSLIEILRKYGLLPFAAGLGAAGKDQR